MRLTLTAGVLLGIGITHSFVTQSDSVLIPSKNAASAALVSEKVKSKRPLKASSLSDSSATPQAAKSKYSSSFDLTGPQGYSVDQSTNTISFDESVYTRIDEEYFKNPTYAKFKTGNAMHDTLRGEGLLERYEIYRKKGSDEIACVVKFGTRLNGYPKIVHGGIQSLVFDNSFGWLFFALKKPMAVTANLNVNYRSPLQQDTLTILKVKMVKEEGRKLFMEAVLIDVQRDAVISDSSTLFIKMKLDKLPWWKRLYLNIFGM